MRVFSQVSASPRHVILVLASIALGAMVAPGCSDDANTGAGTDAGVTADTSATVAIDAGSAPVDSGSTAVDSGPIDSGGVSCTQALASLLKPVDKASTAEASVLSDASGVRTHYWDATAGGSQQAASNPRLYIKLSTGARVDITDNAATTSKDWDLAVKRAVLFTNGGHGGTGQGAAVKLAKAFADVTLADAQGASLKNEVFVNADCEPQLDAIGSIKSSFDGWYDYNPANNVLTPAAGTWVVRGAAGAFFKLEIVTYYGAPDGGVGEAGGRFIVRVAAL